MVGASGFPALDVWLVPRLDAVEEQGLDNFCFCFSTEEGVTHSPDCFLGILIGCKKLEYRRHFLVDANVVGTTARGYSVGSGPDELASRPESAGDAGKEPRHILCVFFYG